MNAEQRRERIDEILKQLEEYAGHADRSGNLAALVRELERLVKGGKA